MKKLIALFILISINAQAATFTETLGGECARLLDTMFQHKLPIDYRALKERNALFLSLQRCLKVYKESGGDMDILNATYKEATETYKKEITDCYINYKDKTEQDDCTDKADFNYRGNLIKAKKPLPWYKRILKK